MTHPDVHPLRVIDQFEELHHVIKIVQRLTYAHEHDVGYFKMCIRDRVCT